VQPSDVNWDRLRAAYEKHGIVLVLGAGVSVGSGLPNWSGLLARVAASWDDGGIESIFRDLRSSGTSLPVVASILEERCRPGETTSDDPAKAGRIEFVKRVRNALYRDFRFFPAGITAANQRELVRHVEITNPTLRTVASLCASRGVGDRTYAPNQKVRAVVTFNLDAVLQEYVDVRYEKHLLRTIERASAQDIPGRINVYHMHGFLRFDPKAGDPAKEAPDAVVLTEQDYFEFFNDPTSLFNYTFLYLLRESPCLFIGLSMQDENIRRLLHFSKQERVRGFVNEGLTPNQARQKTLRHFAILKRSHAKCGRTWRGRRSRTRQLDLAVEESLLPLGTYVLWIDDYGEIQTRLREMYDTAGGDWNLVF